MHLNHLIRRLSYGLLLLALCANSPATFADPPELVVNINFIDMRTGPGRGYPRFYSIARGESLRPIKQRTRWIKVETTKKRKGWILARDLEHTKTLDGRLVRMP